VTALTRGRAVSAGTSRPSPLLIALAAIGGAFLVIVAVNRWAVPSDEHAYWLAARALLEGRPLYDPNATPVTPYAYWYPPVVAQVLAPVALVLPSDLFSVAWTVLLFGCLFYLADRRILVMLALIAFPPVAVELWFRNIHLVLAVLVVAALRGGPDGRPWLWPVGAAIKLAPGLGIAWLAARERWRAFAIAVGVGFAILAVSVVLSLPAWRDWIGIAMSRGPNDGSSLLPIPYLYRAIAGLVLALAAGRLRTPIGEILLVVAITVALPTLWTTGLSLLIAIVPIWSDWRRANPKSAAAPGEAVTAPAPG
jgi:glycosyl transferase family 87